MITWKDSVITNKGIALQGKFTQLGDAVHLTRVAIGDGTVPVQSLKNLTALPRETKDVEISSITERDYTSIITIMMDNIGLETSFSINQIGFYATDPDEGEILYAVAQAATPSKVPTEAESPGYTVQWDFHFTLSNEINMVLEISPTGTLSADMVGKPGGVPPLNNQGKIPDEYLPTASQEEVKTAKIKYYETTFATAEWEEQSDGSYMLEKTYPETDADVCNVLFDRESVTVAQDAGVLSITEFENGTLRMYSETAPTADLTATVELVKGAW